MPEVPAVGKNPDQPPAFGLPPEPAPDEGPPLVPPADWKPPPGTPKLPALKSRPAVAMSAPPLANAAFPAMRSGRKRSSELREPQPLTKPESPLKSRAPQTTWRFIDSPSASARWPQETTKHQVPQC